LERRLKRDKPVGRASAKKNEKIALEQFSRLVIEPTFRPNSIWGRF